MLLTNALNPDGSVADRFEEIPDDIKFKNTVSAVNQLMSRIMAELPADSEMKRILRLCPKPR